MSKKAATLKCMAYPPKIELTDMRNPTGKLTSLLLCVAALCLSQGASSSVVVQRIELASPDGTMVPAEVAFPQGKGPFLPLLYVHARRGYEDVDQQHVTRLAAAGFIVVAPDWQSGRMLERWPVRHDPLTEIDVEAALDHLRAHPLSSKQPVGIIGKSRGPYYAIRLASKRPKDIGPIVSYYGHMQDPNAPEPDQIYRIAPELSLIQSPILMLVGEQDFEVRRINIGRAFYALWERGIPVEYQSYPLARRAFDFRRDQTAEEKIATEHAHGRAVEWLKKHMQR
jgi:Dienelactone hydrolase and related enzymes